MNIGRDLMMIVKLIGGWLLNYNLYKFCCCYFSMWVIEKPSNSIITIQYLLYSREVKKACGEEFECFDFFFDG